MMDESTDKWATGRRRYALQLKKADNSLGIVFTIPTAPVIMPRLAPEKAKELTEKVQVYVNHLVTLDVDSKEFANEIASVHHLGDAEIRSSTSISNRLLDRPTAPLGKLNAHTQVPDDLMKLRKFVEKFDPSRSKVFSKAGFFQIIPFGFGDKVGDYVKKYESAQGHINAIVRAVYVGVNDLKQANISLDSERENIWQVKSHLEEVAYMVSCLEDTLQEKIKEVKASDAVLAKKLEEDGLFYVRQKQQDVLTQIAVCAQSYLAIDIIKKNNFELIKGVDRTTTTTMSALRTAVIIAQALSNQHNVLAQITAIGKTAGNMVSKTSEFLKEQSSEIHNQASTSTLDIEKLQQAFTNTYSAIDSIEGLKKQALDAMKRTVATLSTEVIRAEGYLKQVHHKEIEEVKELEDKS